MPGNMVASWGQLACAGSVILMSTGEPFPQIQAQKCGGVGRPLARQKAFAITGGVLSPLR